MYIYISIVYNIFYNNLISLFNFKQLFLKYYSIHGNNYCILESRFLYLYHKMNISKVEKKLYTQ